jgi:hypothetical protein
MFVYIREARYIAAAAANTSTAYTLSAAVKLNAQFITSRTLPPVKNSSSEQLHEQDCLQ